MGTIVGTAKKLEILVGIIFSKHGTIADAEEFVYLLVNEVDVSQSSKNLQGIIQNCIIESLLHVPDDGIFDVVCRQFACVWTRLVKSTGANRECACNIFISALIKSTQIVCTTIGNSFSIVEHYLVYERLGILSEILRTCVNQVCCTVATSQEANKSDSEQFRYSGEWVIRAVGMQKDDFLLKILLI